MLIFLFTCLGLATLGLLVANLYADHKVLVELREQEARVAGLAKQAKAAATKASADADDAALALDSIRQLSAKPKVMVQNSTLFHFPELADLERDCE